MESIDPANPSCAVSPPGKPNDRISKCGAIAVIVHGVGDHSAFEIEAAVRSGLSAVAPEEVASIAVEETALKLRMSNTVQKAVFFTVRGTECAAIPIIWSDIRPRAGEKYFVVNEGIFTTFQRVVTGATRPLIVTSWNLLRSTYYARGIVRKVALFVVAAASLTLAIAAIIALAWGAPRFVFWYHDHPRSAMAAVVVVVGFALSAWVFNRIFSVTDFFGDVAFFVSSRTRLKQVAESLAAFIRSICDAAPNARILIAGHSLGTVLVSHALLEIREPSRRLLLLTLGSPMRLMAASFPHLIRSPESIDAEFQMTQAVEFWINMWRDEDYIGKNIADEPMPRFGECPLGAGGHTSYWTDRTLWERIIRVMQSNVGDLPSAVAYWNYRPLNDKQQRHLSNIRAFCAVSSIAWGIICAISALLLLHGHTGRLWTALVGAGRFAVSIHVMGALFLGTALVLFVNAALLKRQARRTAIGSAPEWRSYLVYNRFHRVFWLGTEVCIKSWMAVTCALLVRWAFNKLQ